jgi:hypothetical protein
VISVDRTPPVLSVSLTPQPFSPDGDGRDDTLRIDMTADDRSELSYWLLEIFDPYGEFFYDVGGRGSIPGRLRWDGMARNGERVISAERYPWRLEVADELGNVAVTEGEIDVDILVEPFEGGYRIQIPSITFPPNSSVLIVDPDDPQGRQNLAVLRRLVEILGRFPQYSIVVEGHAVNLSGTAREQSRSSCRSRRLVLRRCLTRWRIGASRRDCFPRLDGEDPLPWCLTRTNRIAGRIDGLISFCSGDDEVQPRDVAENSGSD